MVNYGRVGKCIMRKSKRYGGVEVGQGAGLPLGGIDLRRSCEGRASGGVEVGQGAELPLGRMDLRIRRGGRASGGAEVGQGARLPWNATHFMDAAKGSDVADYIALAQ
jgi:hypothetical protein